MAVLLNALGILGAITSLGLFASPGSNIWTIAKNWSVENYTFPPYPMTLLNCVVWVFYGTKPRNWTILGINGTGAILATFFVGMYLWVAFSAGMVVFWRSLGMFCGLSIAGGVVAGLGFGGVVAREDMFGTAGAITAALMYFSAVGDVCRAISTKTVASLSLLIIGTSLANSILWTAYGFASKPRDYYIALPNLFGVVCAVIQLAVYFYYNNIYPVYKAAAVRKSLALLSAEV